jgi:16S rRNA G966 N2-methylase RsmD
MRIIAGQRRGHKIDGPKPSIEMKPTSDRVRESLFNIAENSEGEGSGRRTEDGDD